jgi:acetoacetyl-CoA synthetase
MSCPALGVALAAYDDAGRPVRDRVGELVVTAPMPTMPLYLWNDPSGERYRETYVDTFPGMSRHGDWATVTGRGTVVVHGRLDATLNWGGVPAGQCGDLRGRRVGRRNPGGTHRRTRRGRRRVELSARHVPDEVVAVPGIPHTRTGKKLEAPVKRILAGADPPAVADPGAVDDPAAISFIAKLARSRAMSKSATPSG